MNRPVLAEYVAREAAWFGSSVPVGSNPLKRACRTERVATSHCGQVLPWRNSIEGLGLGRAAGAAASRDGYAAEVNQSGMFTVYEVRGRAAFLKMSTTFRQFIDVASSGVSAFMNGGTCEPQK